MKPSDERHLEYATDVYCLLCNRPMGVVLHPEQLVVLGGLPQPVRLPRSDVVVMADVLDMRCRECGGRPIRGETTSVYVIDRVPWVDPDRPPRGRPPKLWRLTHPL